MVILNACVVCLETKKTLLKWQIISLQELEYSFAEFFTMCICPRLPSTSVAAEDHYVLETVEVGPSENLLYGADSSLKVTK